MSRKLSLKSLQRKVLAYKILHKLRLTSKKNYLKKRQKLHNEQLAYNTTLQKKKIVLLSSKHTAFIAQNISNVLTTYNFDTEVIYDCTPAVSNDYEHLYIILCPNIFQEKLPPHYIAFNLEQTISERWFTKDYINKLNNAIGVLDYSLINVDYLQKNSIAPNRVFYTPIAPIPCEETRVSERMTDILFYGDNHCPRRKRILDKLGEKFHIKIVNNLFHDEMLRELDNAKIVINLHYYEGAMLETPRLCEAISRGCMVVSETSINDDEFPELKEMVDFVPVDNQEALETALEQWLLSPEKLQEKVDQNRKKAQECFKQFSYSIARMLLNYDLVTFESFYRNEKDFFSLGNGKICIGLPESIQRQNYFKSVNKHGFNIFPAIKHTTGWVGCAMTYKFLAQKAVDEGRTQLIICEDDVDFPEDFQQRAAMAEDYFLQSRPDVFSGFIVDMHKDAKIHDIVEKNNMKIILTDKMVSMVYGIYSKYILRIIAKWDYKNRDAASNTVDRYLENQTKLTVAFAHPFLVGHREDLSSTLWGKQNSDLYDELLSNSVSELKQNLKHIQTVNNIHTCL